MWRTGFADPGPGIEAAEHAPPLFIPLHHPALRTASFGIRRTQSETQSENGTLRAPKAGSRPDLAERKRFPHLLCGRTTSEETIFSFPFPMDYPQHAD